MIGSKEEVDVLLEDQSECGVVAVVAPVAMASG